MTGPFTASCTSVATGGSACPTGYGTGVGVGGAYGDIQQGANSCTVSRGAGSGPNTNGPPDRGCGGCEGNPINSANGNKFQEEVDFPSAGEGSLEFVRFYNSAADNYLEVGMGPAWTHTWARTVYLAGTQASVYRPDGKILVFTQSGTAWNPSPDIFDRLTQTSTGWTYVTADNTTETYDSSGKLISVLSPRGRLTTLSYGKGVHADVDYVSPTVLASVTDFRGRTMQFRYRPQDGRMSMMIDPSGGQYLFDYEAGVSSAAPRLKKVTYPDNNSRTYVYNEAAYSPSTTRLAALTGIIDEKGVRFATFAYQADGRAISTEHAGGVYKFQSFTYSNGSTTFTDPLGSVRTTAISLIGSTNQFSGTTQNCPGCGGTSSMVLTFDSTNTTRDITSRKDYNGNLTCYTYDPTRNLETKRVEGLSGSGSCASPISTSATRTVSTQWHSVWRLPVKVAEPLRMTTYSYQGDAGVNCGAPVTSAVCTKTIQATTDTDGSTGLGATLTSDAARTWNYTYTADGQIASVDGPRTDVSDTTTYAYYDVDDSAGNYRKGDLKSVTNALGQVTTFPEYDAVGRLKKSIDANGMETKFTYFPRGWLATKSIGVPTGSYEQTTYDYYPDGSLKSVTAPDGSYFAYTYDDAHRLTRITDTLGNYVQYTLDNYGNRITEEYHSPSALTRKLQRNIDALNRVQADIGGTMPAGSTTLPTTTYLYDANGNRTTITDPLSRVTVQGFDARNRMVSIQDPVNGASALTRFDYDELDQLTKVTDPMGLVTTYGLNGLGDGKSLQSPDTGTANSTYDAAGNIKTRTDARGIVATYSYDALNRLAQVAYPDETVTYTYDNCAFGVGRLCKVSDKTGSTQFTYDVKGRVTSKAHTIGTLSLTMIYGYDSYGRLANITTPSGQVARFSYSNGRPTNVSLNGTNVLTGGAYAPFGPLSGWTWGNSGATANSHVRSLDLDYRVTRVTSSLPATGAQPAFDLLTGWDASSRVLSLQDMSARLGTTTYGYDDLDRLTSAVNASASVNLGYSYNGVGDRTTSTANGAATTYTYFSGTHRLQSLSGAQSKSFAYDNAGNTTSSGSQTWAYGGNNRPTTAGTATFDINALGQRVRKSVGSTVTRFVYDEAGHLWGEYDDAGSLVSETVWLGDLPVAMVRP